MSFIKKLTQICNLITNKENKVGETGQEYFKEMKKEMWI